MTIQQHILFTDDRDEDREYEVVLFMGGTVDPGGRDVGLVEFRQDGEIVKTAQVRALPEPQAVAQAQYRYVSLLAAKRLAQDWFDSQLTRTFRVTVGVQLQAIVTINASDESEAEELAIEAVDAERPEHLLEKVLPLGLSPSVLLHEITTVNTEAKEA